MNDLVRRLRQHDGMLGVLVEEAAEEIERLRERLDKIAKHPDTPLLIKQYAGGILEEPSR